MAKSNKIKFQREHHYKLAYNDYTLADVYYLADFRRKKGQRESKYISELEQKAPSFFINKIKHIYEHGDYSQFYNSVLPTNRYKQPKVKIIDEKEFIAEVKEAIIDCYSIYIRPALSIFILPRHSLRRPANGLAGTDHIFVYLDIGSKNWRQHFVQVFVHEYSHIITSKQWGLQYYSLREIITNEGLAEHFSEFINKAKFHRRYWINQAEAKKILKSKKQLLKSNKSAGNFKQIEKMLCKKVTRYNRKCSVEIYHQLGYFLIGAFLEHDKKIQWEDIYKIPPQKLFAKSWECLMGEKF
ncbi:MAG: hypothetical protein HQ530_01635 [Parcubacteria group bacterium]|nr:hypothetical protein [Parcubacteria group bacterium]